MSPELPAIAAHAAVLRSDARVLAECAERLREIGAGLEAAGVAPQWLRESVNTHLTACVTAAADLDAAAAHLSHYAGRTCRRDI
ncbi:hypothetical protein FHS43_003749 [Streptosporangium becharense]|uniref:Uncharacterized protein n=1 Tax=Streptosporangium becharense TaxID=1816182 RepID=A0A7W9III9_9ACTN|nr:hypothetical protein [Streptosporangium becharense]MBB2912466.1 hypothetical protein [Streptosporangium becharense]MBB5820704.1 hypothetical protein [Streptosporangium becharense]